MKKLLIILIIGGIFAGCKKQDLQQYTEKSRIYLRLEKVPFYGPFPTATAGNLRIDYFPQNSSKKTDTMTLFFQVSGLASNAARSFVFERSEVPGNAIEGVDYDLLNKKFVIPAGAYKDSVRVVIRRSANMLKKEVSFAYNLKMNENFELGPNADTSRFFSNTGVMSMVAINFIARDIAIKPDNWDSFIATYFGVYSEVKYRFIVETLAKISFPTGSTSVSTMNSNKTKLKTALTKYNTTHPEKLKDENGIEISF